MKKRAVIFDLDGTLLNTLEDLAESGNILRAEYGFPAYPTADYAQLVGGGAENLVRRIMPSSQGENFHHWFRRFREIYKQNWWRNCCRYPGINNMLSTLGEMGLSLAVLSNKPHDFAMLCVRSFFPDSPFAAVYGQRQGVPIKPDPASTVGLLSELNCEAEKSIFVGDSGVDMQTGKAAGMSCVGVSWGFRSFDELQRNGADVIIDSSMQLVDYVVASG